MRRFRLIAPGNQLVGSFEIDGPLEHAAPSLRELAEAADTDKTFTFEINEQRWAGVTVREVPGCGS
jgi:hypothetical protein